MYGRDPERLDAARLANVKHWCRCAQIMEKYTASGVDSLSDDECQVLAAALPKRFPHLEELPGYAALLRDCRRRLGASN
jgi:hypothetical protein